MKFLIQARESYMANTDPLRRCYNGCNFSEEKRWTDWGTLGSVATQEEADASVASWKTIGRKTCEFRWVEGAE